MRKLLIFNLLIFLFSTLNGSLVFAKIKLPSLVSDGMVIQRGEKVKIWGWADANEKIAVTFKGKKLQTVADSNGDWSVLLPATKAGGPYSIDVAGETDKITVNDVLVGDVWLCAGQSNMVHNLDLHKDTYEDEIAQAKYPDIRQFLISTIPALYGPADDIPNAEWKAASPSNVLKFSMVAYFFAKKLYDQYQVPIGLINASVGGSPIETWMSESGLKEFPDFLKTVETNKDTAYVSRINNEASAKRREMSSGPEMDKGLTGSKKWYDINFVPKNWRRMNIPGYWEDQGIKDLNGVVWYRREIDVPASMVGKPARLSMGRIVDADYCYINGTLVGNKTYQYPQRRYDVPAGVLKEGKNIFVIRVLNQNGKGGFVPDKPYYLAVEKDTLDLKGYWQYRVGEVYSPEVNYPSGISMRHQPTGFYNGMVATLTNQPIKGVLWYQGESNSGKPQEYKKLLPALIADWRNQWNQKDLPFLYVQLPGFMEVNYWPSESNWAELRQAQLDALSVPNTAMAVAIDLGEWNDIHPDIKKPIGDRLALAAQKMVYGDKKVVYSGPIYSSSTVIDNRVELTFKHVGGGLISSDDEELKWFALAGEDKKFTWAKAIIEEDKVVIWSKEVTDPVYIRYAWLDNPDGANLYNMEGLPASPFEAQISNSTQP